MRDGIHPASPGSVSTRRPSFLFIVGLLSVAANILFVAILFRNHGRASISVNSPVTSQLQEPDHSDSAAESQTQITDPLATFRWTEIDSTDSKQYIENLRDFGLPERTIRDVIMGQVQRLYRPRLTPYLRGNSNSKSNFWEVNRMGFNQSPNLTSEQRAQLKSLQKEQKEMVESLLGKNVYQDIARESGNPDWTERMFGFSLPADKRDLISEMQQRYQEAKSEVYAKTEGYFDQDTQAEIKGMESKFHDELAKVLTPEQLLEYQMRSSDLASNLKYQMGAFEPTEQEYRAIFQYKQSLSSSTASGESRKDAERVFEETLGPDRLKEYNLLQDNSYQSLAMGGVSRDAILQVAATKAQAEESAAALRRDQSLTAEQRTESLQALRRTSEDTLAALLGQRRARAYLNSGGYWIRNIAPMDHSRGAIP